MTHAPSLMLKPHQEREVRFLREHPRALLLSETGTGKTITMLTRVQDVLAAGDTVCWITSTSLQTQLVQEAQVWLPEGHQPVALRDASPDDRFFFLTHRLAITRIAEILKRGPVGLLVVDEASEVGGGGAKPRHKTYTSIKQISLQAKASIFATAEPLGALHALDLWALADCAVIPGTPSRYEMNGWVNWNEHRAPGGRIGRSPSTVTDHGFNRLVSIIRPHQIRTRIDDIASLPEMVRHEHVVRLSVSRQGDYDQIDGQRGLDGHLARQKTSRDSSVLIPYVMDLLEGQYSDHSSVLIFSEMFDLLVPLSRGLEERGIGFGEIVGHVNGAARGDVMERHRNGDIRVLVMSIAAEKGVNAQHSKLLISLVQSYSPSRERQREGRIRRIGSVGPQLVHAIVRPEVSHEDRRDEILDAKDRLIAAMWAGLE